ncbi:hypothetical protein ACVWZD_003239 [Streptomyces sp. TE3672]
MTVPGAGHRSVFRVRIRTVRTSPYYAYVVMSPITEKPSPYALIPRP